MEVEVLQKQEKGAVQVRRRPSEERMERKKKLYRLYQNLTYQNSFESTGSRALTGVNPGEGAGFGTEVGPVIGCGGLFISRSFMVLH